jgi:hypothetical protein
MFVGAKHPQTSQIRGRSSRGEPNLYYNQTILSNLL